MASLSLGIVEVIGLTTAITAADAMVKAANVQLVGYEITNGMGLVTVTVSGDVSSAQAAVEAGVTAASRVGTVFARLVIARPDTGIEIFNRKDRTKALVPAQVAQAAGQSHFAETEAQPEPDPREQPAVEQQAEPVAEINPEFAQDSAPAAVPDPPEQPVEEALDPAASVEKEITPVAAGEQEANSDGAPSPPPGSSRTKKKSEPKFIA
jgi:microcompartment protein CcmL/EutN